MVAPILNNHRLSDTQTSFPQRSNQHIDCTMASNVATSTQDDFHQTVASDSENYDISEEPSSSPHSSSSSPLVLYSPPTLWGLLRGAAINLVLPFINGMMLGFGELFAHEAAFRLGWSQTKVRRVSLCFVRAVAAIASDANMPPSIRCFQTTVIGQVLEYKL